MIDHTCQGANLYIKVDIGTSLIMQPTPVVEKIEDDLD